MTVELDQLLSQLQVEFPFHAIENKTVGENAWLIVLDVSDEQHNRLGRFFGGGSSQEEATRQALQKAREQLGA